MKKPTQILLVAGVAAALLAGCSGMPGTAELDQLTQDILKASFRDQGQAKTDRLVA